MHSKVVQQRPMMLLLLSFFITAFTACTNTFEGTTSPLSSPERATIIPAYCVPAVENAQFGAPDTTEGRSITTRVKELFDADQAARTSNEIESVVLFMEDQQWRIETMKYLEQGQIIAAESLCYAAIIFQHGDCPEHYMFANQLAKYSMERGYKAAVWIYAASLDRYLINTGQPQKFGTQYHLVDDQWELMEVDPETTDEERQRYGVPSLVEAKTRAKDMEVPDISPER